MLRTTAYPSIATGLTTLALGIGSATAGGERLFSIPPGFATETVMEWSRQSGVQVGFAFDSLQGVRTRAVVGAFRAPDALGALLRDTPLTYEIENPRTVVVLPGTQQCQPWQGAEYAPLPPCVPGPEVTTL